MALNLNLCVEYLCIAWSNWNSLVVEKCSDTFITKVSKAMWSPTRNISSPHLHVLEALFIYLMPMSFDAVQKDLGEKWFQIADMYYYSKNRNYLRICRINLFIYIRQYDVECEYIWTLVVYHFQCNGKLISKQRGKFHSRKHLSFKFVLFFVLAMLKSYVYDTACSLHRHHHHHRTKCALYMYVCIMIGQPGIYIYKYCVFEIYLICALEFPIICVRNT